MRWQYYEKMEKYSSNYCHGMSYDRRDSYESVSGSVETLVEKYPCLKDRGSRVLYWENVSSEKINEFDKLAKEATVFNGTMQELLGEEPTIVELQTEY